MVNLGNMFFPVHCSKKEVRRLRAADYSYREIGLVLGVSLAQAHRINNGYRCRCGMCPRARSMKKLLALAEGPPSMRPRRTRRPRVDREDGGNESWISKAVNTVGAGLTLWKIAKGLKDGNLTLTPDKDKNPDWDRIGL